MDNPDTGDSLLTDTVTSPTAGSNCPAGGGDARCTVTVAVVGAATLTFTRPSAATSATAGSDGALHDHGRELGPERVRRGAAFTDPLTGMLDDAAYDGDAAASSGTRDLRRPRT